MINSVLMLFSQYNKNTMQMNICAAAWIVHMFFHSDFQVSFFLLVNLATFLVATLFVRKIKNKYLRMAGATSSILLYSVCIDIVCYFLYPMLVFDQNLLSYVWNGLIFNLKYLFSNGLALFLAVMLKKIALKYKKIPFDFFQLSNIKF